MPFLTRPQSESSKLIIPDLEPVAIALLIGSVILGMSAPMISKQLQHNTLNDIKSRILKGEIEKVESKANTNITNIKNHDTKILNIQKQLTALEKALDAIEVNDYDDEISALESELSSKANSSTVTKISNDLTTLEETVGDLDEDVTDLEDKIKNLVPKGAVMFFNLTSCPDGWSAITDMGGRYPRIATYKDGKLADAINSTKEQMVHRHKHVSPFMAFAGAGMMNMHRYGPYLFPGTIYSSTFNKNVQGDYNYSEPLNMNRDANGNYYPSSYTGNAFAFYGMGYPSNWHYNTITYTSDGMNRKESLFGIKTTYSMDIKDLVVCPNRDENDKICKPSGNNYGIPYLSEMPLVGNENRPNSVVWLACQKE